VDGVGFDVMLAPKRRTSKLAKVEKPPPPDKKPDDDNMDNEEDDILYDSEEDPIKKIQEGDEGGILSSQGCRGGQENSGRRTTEGETQGEVGQGLEMAEKKGMEGQSVTKAVPIAMLDPVSGSVLEIQEEGAVERGGEGEEMLAETKEKQLEMVESMDRDKSSHIAKESPAAPVKYFLVHTEGGGRRYITKDKWPTLTGEWEGDLEKEMLQVSQESLGAGEIEHVSEPKSIDNSRDLGCGNLKQRGTEGAGGELESTTTDKEFPITKF
jgi:hypothetical protein